MHHLDDTRAYIEEMMKREAALTHLYASIVLKSTEEIIGTIQGLLFYREYVS